jgi:hypothetical protein
MDGPVPRQRYPWWVKVSLWGSADRAAVWAFVWMCVVMAVGCVVYAVLAPDARFFGLGVVSLLGALAYWLSIRWVDRHGSWER